MVLRLMAVFVCAMQVTAQGTGPGVFAGLGNGSISVRVDGRTRRFVVNKQTEIWRGQNVGVRQLCLGDRLQITYRTSASGEAVATQIWANIDRWDGKVTRVTGNIVEVARNGEHGEHLGVATVVFDGRTVFNQGSRQDVRIGRELEVVGLVLDKHRIQATRVLHIVQ